ncbi:MAG: hypothetical protein AAGI24_03920 [Pseudomonadota bacterium]
MNKKEIQKNISKYSSYMREIRRRTDVAMKIVSLRKAGNSLTGDDETDIDLMYLQLRKVSELIMFACVVARKTAGDNLNRVLRKGYEIGKLRKELENLNLNYFPVPKYDKGTSAEGIRSVGDLQGTDSRYASATDLLSTYGRASNYLHAQREDKYGNDNAKIRLLDRATEEFNSIIALLNHHWIQVTEDTFFAVVMRGIEDGEVQVSLMERVDDT